ncbi:hypothetical protein DENSPDRAFT_229371 [Dentipellis sp. KUC8613]|nr:hypothetical protein DENSPDRAFT_229371 [Dentipellis sp. KUC8613]
MIRSSVLANVFSFLTPIMLAQLSSHPSHFREPEDEIQVTPAESVAGISGVLGSYMQDRLNNIANVTTFRSLEAINKAQACLDTDIEALKRVLRAFCSRRNAISIISRLPADVLLCIFAILVEADPPKMIGTSRTCQQRFGWIQITHVCHSWREISLSSPGLWSCIGRDLTKEWTMAMLSRSKRCPLEVDLAIRLTASEDNISEILSTDHLSRTSELRLEASTGNHPWAQKLQVLAPILSSLHLHFTEPQKPTSHPLSEVISTVSHPSLRRLIIYNHFQPPCDARVLENLTHLEINGTRHYYEQPTAEQFIPIIQQLSRIQTLILKRCRPHGHAVSFDGYLHRRRYSLPHLRKLSLRGFGCAVPLLLGCMDIPSSAKVSLHLEKFDNNWDCSSWPLIPQLLPWATVSPIDGETHFDHLIFDMRRAVHLCTSTSSEGSHLTISSNVDSFQPDNLHHFLQEFYARRYFRSLSCLILSASVDNYVYSEVKGLLTSPSMAEVTDLHLIMPISTLPHLLQNLSMLTANAHSCCMLPALEKITLEGPEPQAPHNGNTPIPYSLSQSLQEELLNFLRVRRSLGKPITYTLLPSIANADEFRGYVQSIRA